MGELERILIEAVVLCILGGLGIRRARGIVILSREALDVFEKKLEALTGAQHSQAKELRILKESHEEQFAKLQGEIHSLPCTKERIEHGSS